MTTAGVDVYNGDGTVDWQKARQAGQTFGYCKASEGVSEVDAHCARNLAGMRAAGILAGCYHFFRMNADPVQQARHFLNTVTLAGYDTRRDLPLCVDIEEDSVKGGPYSADQVTAALARFNSIVEQHTGRRNLIYVDRSTAEAYLHGGEPFSGHDLWHAQYTSAATPHLPYGWKTWRVWQYGEYGSVAGLPNRGGVDVDRFNGALADLRAWAGTQSLAMALPQSRDVGAQAA